MDCCLVRVLFCFLAYNLITILALPQYHHHEVPHIHAESPHSHGEGPHSHGEEPHSHGEGPHSHGEEPHSHGEGPHSHGEGPHSHGEGPHSHGEESQPQFEEIHDEGYNTEEDSVESTSPAIYDNLVLGAEAEPNVGIISKREIPETMMFPSSKHYHSKCAPSDKVKHVACTCALFSVKFPIETDAPLMSKTFHNVSCHGHVSGGDVCTEVCISYAASYNTEKANAVCSYLHNAINVRGFMHSKVCHRNNDTHDWTFTNFQIPKPICCQNGEAVECESKISEIIVI